MIIINTSKNRIDLLDFLIHPVIFPTFSCFQVNLDCIKSINLNDHSHTYDGALANIVTVRDITERQLTQRKLESLYQRELQLSSNLKDEVDKRSRYTRALVHELKTPLTAILASSELLESEVHDNTISALIGNIRRASLNLEQRINELIELARGEIGLLRIDPNLIDISELIHDIVDEMAPVAAARGLNLTSEVSTIPPVHADKGRLKQVLTNLISNAFKFTDQGEVSIKVKYNDPDSLLIQVKDTGRGISFEELEHIFDPYRRRSSEKQALGGLGIGLAISKMIIELHHGKIWAENNPGGGAVFSFIIPLKSNVQGNRPN